MQGLRNLADVIRNNAHSGQIPPDRPALIWHDVTVTWAELDATVDSYARGLHALGLQKDAAHPARVAIALPNRPEFAAVYFATLRAGLVAVPVNIGYTGRELHQLLDDAAAAVLVATDAVLAELDSFGTDLPALRHRIRVGAAATGAAGTDLGALARPGDPVEAETGGEDLAVLLFTSGTEGRAKGAMLSHRALLANHAQLAAIEPPPIGPDDVALLAVPLFHAYGLNSGLGAVAYHGATGVLVEAFDPAETLRLIAAHQVTAVIGVPTMFLAWSLLAPGPAFTSVRVAVSGAAPLSPETARRFHAATSKPVFIGYGLTEAAPVLTTSLASPVPKEGSIGRAIPGVDIRLVGATGEDVWRSDEAGPVDDFDDDASGSPGTDPGEIVARGANLFSGYWPDGRDGPVRPEAGGEAGWWATGDVAYADADGDLFLVDRLGELIIVNGFNVYPQEVEQVLAAHPAVEEAAALGMPHPYTGQTVKAYVVATTPIGADELMAYCERNLARFKCPTAIEFVNSLPHSATGKVRKTLLREAAEPARAEA